MIFINTGDDDPELRYLDNEFKQAMAMVMQLSCLPGANYVCFKWLRDNGV